MATTSAELDQFLADLNVRRQRVITLVGTEEGTAGLVEELLELSEQLLVADEELRVQQEELENTRRRLDGLALEWSAMFESSSAALVLTDQHGVVLQVTRAAAQLVLQPPSRRTPRPIATWFEVADRSRIRGLISQRDLGRPLTFSGATLLRSDGSTVAVDVRVTPTSSSAHDQTVLSWELTVADGSALRLLDLDARPESDPRVARGLADAVRRLDGIQGLPATLTAAAEEAVRLVPGAASAVVVVAHQSQTEVLASTGDGPAALAGSLALPLAFPGCPTAELRVHADPNWSWSAEATEVAELLAVHLRVAVRRAVQEDNLRRAVESRQLIGQAIGQLVERRRITTEAAFDELTRCSQRRNVKLRDVARLVVETGLDPDQLPLT